MKKLMIAAAVAAMVGGASAADALKAQVYDFTATLKTTACSGKSAKDVCGTEVQYRIQKTQKLYGKFWGCHCQVIACPDNYGEPRTTDEKSFIFWTNAKKEDGAFHNATWTWEILQRLGKKGNNVEGQFTLTLEDCKGKQIADLMGAGYGTAQIYCDGADSAETSYIKSMSGNIAGKWDVTSDPLMADCAYCGDPTDCTVLAFCATCDAQDNEWAAAFGSFTIKYNASESKSVNKGKYIDELSLSEKKNKAAYTEMWDCIADDGDDDEKTPAEVAQEQYTKAKEALAKANADFTTSTNALVALEGDSVIGGSETLTSTTCQQGQDYIDDLADATTAEAKTAKAVAVGDSTFDKLAAKDSAVTAAITALLNDKKAVVDAERVMNLAQKYSGKVATYNTAKTAYENAQKAVLDESVNPVTGSYVDYTNVVAKFESLGTTTAADKKLVSDLAAALDAEIAAYKAVNNAEDVLNLWKGEYFDGTTNQTITKPEETAGTYAKACADAEESARNNYTAVEDAKENLKYAEIACTASGTVCK